MIPPPPPLPCPIAKEIAQRIIKQETLTAIIKTDLLSVIKENTDPKCYGSFSLPPPP
jgi:hypothetical protein